MPALLARLVVLTVQRSRNLTRSKSNSVEFVDLNSKCSKHEAARPHLELPAAMADHGAGERLLRELSFYVATRINKESIAQPSIYGYRD